MHTDTASDDYPFIADDEGLIDWEARAARAEGAYDHHSMRRASDYARAADLPPLSPEKVAVLDAVSARMTALVARRPEPMRRAA